MSKLNSGQKQFAINALRRASQRWPPKTKIKKEGKAQFHEGYYKNGNPKMKYRYHCESCHVYVDVKKLDIDHIKPIVNVNTGFTDLDDFANNLLCGESDLQRLCKGCHKEKSSKENKKRVAKRKSRKKLTKKKK